MVAEPVSATMSTIKSMYDDASSFVSNQHEKFINSEYYEKLNSWDLSHLVSPPRKVEPVHNSLIERFWDRIKNNKVKVASILSIGIGLTSLYIYESSQCNPVLSKRKVPKLKNGARRDVVLVVGSPTEPLTRLIVLDFEKRGFIVYLTILSEKDFRYIESNPITDDINYLNLNEGSKSLTSQLDGFTNMISKPVIPFSGAEPHNLKLSAIVFAPNLYFPLGPIESISMSSWDRVYERIFIVIQLFASGLVNLARQQQSKVIALMPSIVSTLQMPYHAPETVFQNTLKDYFTSLAREMSNQGIYVTQVRLGNLNISSTKSSYGRVSNIVNSEISSWDEDIKSIYAQDFSRTQLKSSPISRANNGSNLRDLYHTLFDLIYSKTSNPALVYCGAGARFYDWISSILPQSTLAWFLK